MRERPRECVKISRIEAYAVSALDDFVRISAKRVWHSGA